jgi:hypothetical protein
MEPEIKTPIPEVKDEEVVTLPWGTTLGNFKKHFEKIDQVLFGIMIGIVLSVIAIIIAVIGLFLDQMRINNLYYKEYSQKTSSIETDQKTNQNLLKSNQLLTEQVKENQDIIKQLILKK